MRTVLLAPDPASNPPSGPAPASPTPPSPPPAAATVAAGSLSPEDAAELARLKQEVVTLSEKNKKTETEAAELADKLRQLKEAGLPVPKTDEKKKAWLTGIPFCPDDDE
jgi:hypothetical protein